ncbi:ATP-binding cassette domain-containing protein [Deinococcus sp. KNUC1210]|uniref:ATP-binding cassette domain-containing protein n=1 Tax=Deinococcus sp. KNUC1210 TaxID=2917691 RepID=UPI00351CD01A
MLVGLQDVIKDYGTRAVLNGISLQIEPGDRLALVGRNGAGKSTLLKVLTGAVVPDAGTVLRGQDVRVRALAQDPVFPEGSTIERGAGSGLPRPRRARTRPRCGGGGHEWRQSREHRASCGAAGALRTARRL